MYNGSLTDFFLAICLVTVFLFLALTVIYVSQQLRRVTIPSLLGELERLCDVILSAADDNGRTATATDDSFLTVPGSAIDHWPELDSLVVQLNNQIESLLTSWVYKRRGRPRGMRSVATRLETLAGRLAAYRSSGCDANDAAVCHYEALQATLRKLRSTIAVLKKAERHGNVFMQEIFFRKERNFHPTGETFTQLGKLSPLIFLRNK